MHSRCLVAAAIAVAMSVPCAAQDVRVKLTDSKRPIAGRLIRLDSETLAIQVKDGTMEIPLTRVIQVDKQVHDSLLNGAIAGMLYVAACVKWWCGQGLSGPYHPTGTDIALGAAVGAAAGARWDALFEKRETIYRGPAPAAPALPRAAVAFRVRF
jgi:hypothetical protein